MKRTKALDKLKKTININNLLGIKKSPARQKQLLPTVLNAGIFALTLFYIWVRFEHINNVVPIWYTKPWGEDQLGNKGLLFIIPGMILVNTVLGFFLASQSRKFFLRFGREVIFYITTVCNTILAISAYRVVGIASKPFKPLIEPEYLDLLIPFLVAFVTVGLIGKPLIKFFEDKNIVTDPSKHTHPGMIRTRPAARGGGVIFFIAFALTSLIFVGNDPKILGIVVTAGLLTLLGLLDDIQNTQNKSRLRFLESPTVRLLALFLITSVLLFAGIRIEAINNPLNGILSLTTPVIELYGTKIQPISMLFTLFWVVWVINLLSWSNGIDGQYAGIIGISGVVIMLLSLRFVPLENIYRDAAATAAILAGAGFAMTIFTWSPAKIMWGFGATSAGLIVAGLSIIISGKVATSLLILIVPFVDAAVTIGRRIMQGRNPLKADRGHLHHILLERNWGTKRIAAFYWGTTAISGIIAILASDRATPLFVITITGFVAFFIILLNISFIRNQHPVEDSPTQTS